MKTITMETNCYTIIKYHNRYEILKGKPERKFMHWGPYIPYWYICNKWGEFTYTSEYGDYYTNGDPISFKSKDKAIAHIYKIMGEYIIYNKEEDEEIKRYHRIVSSIDLLLISGVLVGFLASLLYFGLR